MKHKKNKLVITASLLIYSLALHENDALSDVKKKQTPPIHETRVASTRPSHIGNIAILATPGIAGAFNRKPYFEGGLIVAEDTGDGFFQFTGLVAGAELKTKKLSYIEAEIGGFIGGMALSLGAGPTLSENRTSGWQATIAFAVLGPLAYARFVDDDRSAHGEVGIILKIPIPIYAQGGIKALLSE